jgi:hypothetical protein
VTELFFQVGERVRLINEFQGVPKGTEGVIYGFYRNDPPRYAVVFGRSARQVPPEHLEAAEPKRP